MGKACRNFSLTSDSDNRCYTCGYLESQHPHDGPSLIEALIFFANGVLSGPGLPEADYLRLCEVVKAVGPMELVTWIKTWPDATDDHFYIKPGREFPFEPSTTRFGKLTDAIFGHA